MDKIDFEYELQAFGTTYKLIGAGYGEGTIYEVATIIAGDPDKFNQFVSFTDMSEKEASKQLIDFIHNDLAEELSNQMAAGRFGGLAAYEEGKGILLAGAVGEDMRFALEDSYNAIEEAVVMDQELFDIAEREYERLGYGEDASDAAYKEVISNAEVAKEIFDKFIEEELPIVSEIYEHYPDEEVER